MWTWGNFAWPIGVGLVGCLIWGTFITTAIIVTRKDRHPARRT